MKPVLVTGGAGFIGANLCRALISTGRYEVTVVDDLSTGYRTNLDDVDVTFVEGSITDADLMAEVTPDGGLVVHLAALGSVPRSVADPITSHAANATGTLRVLEAARSANVDHVIVASSSSVYGDNDAPAKHEELPTAPKSPYGASKLATEGYAIAFQRTYDLGITAFRFFNVFGPLQSAGHAYAAVIPSFIDRALRGEPLIVHGDGGQSRDFTYVDTVCGAIVAALDQRATFDGPVNLAFGTQVSLLEVIAIIERRLGTTLELEHQDPRPGDIRASKADPARLQSLLGDLDVVDIDTGIGHTIDWFKQLS